ncbi:L-threonylcarbamoyladenylate synthase [Ereboglobus sp. PH5-10]|uniref:L-threonylcarbamoyladenylate synthase n=1 Tax=Ereboglobus sp. PH5-10 TaxID=2940629 RepID=UPI00240760B8|nr:L-threonylcarbamoyladenylate synthase [Ereboglobus sp. PH5-10]MDF9827121.1 L-threonylcarbamoyladenylate synthase [Ereboglobus sp. PH5-10]
MPFLKTRIYRGTPRNLAMLASALQRGELVAVPTETVYGLAGNAFSTDACAAIFRAKGRPANDPLIVHIHDLAQLDQLAHRNPAVEKLARAFWPGPLTLVLPKKDTVPDLATSGLPSVAVRMPAHPLFRALLKKCGLPLVAPSANPFGYISPTCAAHVRDGLRGKIRHILNGGDCDIGLESTIVDLRGPRCPKILRPGKIGAAEIARVLRVPVTAAAKKRPAKTARAELAPGMLSKHYSPKTPVVLHARITPALIARIPKNEAVLPLFASEKLRDENIFPLSEKQDLGEAAHNLFAALRALDGPEKIWKRIHAELAPASPALKDRALAAALNDRLTRAAA